MRTHPNQPGPLPDHNSWDEDSSLRFWTQTFAAEAVDGWGAQLKRTGEAAGSLRLEQLADQANRNPPTLMAPAESGWTSDIDFSAAWHDLLEEVSSSGICAAPWNDAEQATGQGYAIRAALFEMYARVDMGVMCPVSMTTAAVPVFMRHGSGADREWVRRLCGRVGEQAFAGMAMTEPQGGSDLSRTTTTAREHSDGTLRLSGYKWFCSHPVSDVLLVLAMEEAGLSCFVVPRTVGDGERNSIDFVRLKDKLGTRSLASAELELHDAQGTRIGDAGAGIRTIIEMVNHTRMDCVIGSAGVMRRAVLEANHYATRRTVFGGLLADQPLMRAVLADMTLEREAALALAFEVARCFDAGDELARLVTPVAKYWVTRRAVSLCVEAVEACGGNGYTEEFPLARLYRDAQVNSTWEGSGNVIVLDIFRAIGRRPDLLLDLRQRLADLCSQGSSGAQFGEEVLQAFDDAVQHVDQVEAGRVVAGRLAVALSAGLLLWRADASGEGSDEAVASAYVRTRVLGNAERIFGSAVGQELLSASVPE